MKKYLFIIIAFLSATAAAAQDDISRQLEVTKAYTPKVGMAAKLPVRPRMTDTVRLRPEITYTITPTTWETAFEAEKLRPATIGVVPFDKTRPLYLRAGVGFPLQSTLDLYINPYTGNRSTFGVFLNHRGSFSKIKNDIGIKTDARSTTNELGLYGSRHYKRYTLDGDFSIDIRYFEPYGAYDADIAVLTTAMYPTATIIKRFSPGNDYSSTTFFGRVRGGVGFGDTFTDLSRLNFRVGLNTGFAFFLAEQFDIDFHAKVAKMFRPHHGFELTLWERGAIDVLEPDISSVATVLAPRYIWTPGRFRLRAGLDLRHVYNSIHDQNSSGITPAAEATLDLAGGRFVPWLNLSSQMLDGSFDALTRRNPYCLDFGPTGWTTDLRLGFSGNIAGIFTCKIGGGLSWLRDYHIFTAYQDIYVDEDPTGTYTAFYEEVDFRVSGDHGMKYTAGAELGLRNLGGFSARLSANWYRFDMRTDIPTGDPEYDAGLRLAWSHRGKFTLTAGAKLIGRREYFNVYDIRYDNTLVGLLGGGVAINRIDAAVDVSLGAEYNVADGFGFFVEGSNLAGQKLYPWNHHRGLGANLMLGIKAVF